MSNLKIRVATPMDNHEILEIYKPYILNTAITFEYDIPTLDDFTNRIVSTLKRYPYIVAIEYNQIVGYAYASEFKNRKAYDWAVETSIYIKQGFHGKGYGKKLYQVLEDILKRQNILNVNACISCTDTEDEHLTNDSIYFHQHLGYSMVGKFHSCGYKFNKWFDMVWLEKSLNEHTVPVKDVIPFSQISNNINF